MSDKSEYVLDVIEKIANIDFQRDVWFKAKYYDNISSLPEAVETLEDFHFYDDIDENKLNLSEDDLVIVRHFLDNLLRYENKYSMSMLIDPKWQEVVNEAKIVLEIFKKYTW